MDPAARIDQDAMRLVKPIDEATEPGDSDVQRFYQDAVLFITGGTGFIGKQLLEKLFRSCNIKKAFVLIRPKKGRSTNDRIQEMLNDPVFEPVSKKKPDLASRIICVEGDVASIQLGISNDDWKTIVEEVNVIFHVAATVRFDENIRTAAMINVRGTREALALGRACKNLWSFIHVSTAYSHATLDRAGNEVLEQFYKSPLPADTLLTLVDTVDAERLDTITESLISGWPNTYTFTKAIAEELVQSEGGSLPVCIVRPSIVINSYQEPMPGWIDTSCVHGPMGVILGCGLGVLRTFYINNSLKLSYVPVDFVNNATITAGWNTGIRGLQKPLIYSISSTACGITFAQMFGPIRSPKIRGVVSPATLWYCYVFETNNRLLYWFFSWILHYIPAYIIDSILDVFAIKKPVGLKSMVHLYSKIDKMANVLSYFTTNEWNLDDTNARNLWKKMSKTDRTIFNFEMGSIDWLHYMLMCCIGLRKYVIKDGLKGTEAAVARQKWLWLANFAVMVTYLAVLAVMWVILSWLWLFVKLVF